MPRACRAAGRTLGRRAERSAAPGLRGHRGRCPSPTSSSAIQRPRYRARSGAGSCWAARLRGWRCQITWRVHRGHLLGFEVDLPPAWVPDRVRIAGVDEPVDWHPEVLARRRGPCARGPPGEWARPIARDPDGGGHRDCRGRPRPARPSPRPARRSADRRRALGRLDRPQPLAPADCREGPRLDRSPTRDRSRDEPVAVERGTRRVARYAGLALARPASPGRGTRRSRAGRDRAERYRRPAARASSATRVRYEWQIVVQAGEDAVASIAVGTSAPWEDPEAWHFEEETSGLELPDAPLDTAADSPRSACPRRDRRGSCCFLIPGAVAWSFARGSNSPGPVAEHLPLLVLPEHFHTRGTVVIEVHRSVRSMVEATGLRALDPTVAVPAPAAGDGARARPRRIGGRTPLAMPLPAAGSSCGPRTSNPRVPPRSSARRS